MSELQFIKSKERWGWPQVQAGQAARVTSTVRLKQRQVVLCQ